MLRPWLWSRVRVGQTQGQMDVLAAERLQPGLTSRKPPPSCSGQRGEIRIPGNNCVSLMNLGTWGPWKLRAKCGRPQQPLGVGLCVVQNTKLWVMARSHCPLPSRQRSQISSVSSGTQVGSGSCVQRVPWGQGWADKVAMSS